MKENDNCISIKWYVSDVREVRPDLDFEDCQEVLALIEEEHDCNVGVTWAVVREEANRLFPLKKGVNGNGSAD